MQDSRLDQCKNERYRRLIQILRRQRQDALTPYTEPLTDIPPELYDEFTMDGKAAVRDWYFNHKPKPGEGSFIIDYPEALVRKTINNIMRREYKSYGVTNDYLHAALNRYPIKGDVTLIIGSTFPQFEAFCIAYGAKPITIEYNARYSECDELDFFTPEQFEEIDLMADSVIAISSYEHDGLGRYGDPIDPNGDLKSMKALRDSVKPGGRLFVSVPLGRDTVVWNAHRIYGPDRLPLLFEGWRVIDSTGAPDGLFTIENGEVLIDREAWFDFHKPAKSGPEWVFVLENP